MNQPFQQNPYESPIQAELVERPKRKALPVGSIALGLLLAFALSAGLSAIHPLWFLLFPVACVAILAWICGYDLWRWFTS